MPRVDKKEFADDFSVYFGIIASLIVCKFKIRTSGITNMRETL